MGGGCSLPIYVLELTLDGVVVLFYVLVLVLIVEIVVVVHSYFYAVSSL